LIQEEVVIGELVRAAWGVYDADVAMFVDHFVAARGSKILVVGAHDEAMANMLAASGFDVVGIDLRGYDQSLPPCNYRFIRGDFCEKAALCRTLANMTYLLVYRLWSVLAWGLIERAKSIAIMT